MDYNKSFAERIKKNYPPGTRIKLDHMDDPYAPIPPGTKGTVICVDDIGQIHMRWDNGSGLALIPGEDSFHKISPKELFEEDLKKNNRKFAYAVENDILSNIDFERFKAEYENNDWSYLKEILGELHGLFIRIYDVDTVNSDYGYMDVPGIVESQKSGDIYPALLNIDFSSSGDIWDLKICKKGATPSKIYQFY